MADPSDGERDKGGGSGLPRGAPVPPPSLGALARVYLKISLLGFGGPNAHLALMLDEVVERRGWLDRARFLEIMALTNFLPGPNSSEVAIHVGYAMRGRAGALVTGLVFLGPTFLMVTALSAIYFRLGTLPEVEALFWGLQPVIVAIVISAGIKIGRAGVTGPLEAALAALGGGVSLFAGRWILAAMVLGGVVTLARAGGGRGAGGAAGGKVGALVPSLLAGTALGAGTGPLAGVFLTHLWIGSVLFGGGYVLVALLEPFAVTEFGWLTAPQLLDGVALTQAVPGPISTLAAFVGYAAAGVPGAVLATAGIYLPAFVAVLVTAPRLEHVRGNRHVRAMTRGVVAVAAGAVLGVGASLVGAGVRDPAAASLAIVALALSVWKRVPSVWLVGAGLLAGGIRYLVG